MKRELMSKAWHIPWSCVREQLIMSGMAIAPAMRSDAASEHRHMLVGFRREWRLYTKYKTNEFVRVMQNPRRASNTNIIVSVTVAIAVFYDVMASLFRWCVAKTRLTAVSLLRMCGVF